MKIGKREKEEARKNFELAKTCLEESLRVSKRADDEGRKLTADEKARMEYLDERSQHYTDEGKRLADPDSWATGEFVGYGGEPEAPESEWRDMKTGAPVHVLHRDQKFSEVYGHVEPYALGKLLVAHFVGRSDFLSPELRVMSEGTNFLGGYMVPDALSSQVIDLARNKSVAFTLGARTVPMQSETLRIARVASDPVIDSPKVENAQFSITDPVIDSVLLTARTLGQVVQMSRELAEDAPNAAQAVENSLAQNLALAIDTMVIDFLLLNDSVQELTSIGAIAWTDLLDAMELIELQNGTPNGYVTNPAVTRDLRGLLDSNNLWLKAPPGVEDLKVLSSNQVLLANAFVADWKQIIVGVRNNVRIEVSTEAGTSFAAHQLWIKVTWRGDANMEHQDHAVRLLGITS